MRFTDRMIVGWCSLVVNINRLKKVQGKKKRDGAARESARAAEEADNVTLGESEPTADDEGGGDLLSSKDEDVIF